MLLFRLSSLLIKLNILVALKLSLHIYMYLLVCNYNMNISDNKSLSNVDSVLVMEKKTYLLWFYHSRIAALSFQKDLVKFVNPFIFNLKK